MEEREKRLARETFPGQINQDFELEGMVLGGLFFPISDVAFLVEEA